MNVQKEHATAPLAGFRILVVEDNPFIAADLLDQLASRGAQVLGPVPSIRAALTSLCTERPDAAVLDVNLRGEMSTPIAAALRASAVPFVLATGYSRDQLEEPDFHDAPLILKPVSPDQLVRILRQLTTTAKGTVGRDFTRSTARGGSSALV